MREILMDFRSGLEAYSEAFDLIKSMNLWGYLILPGLLSLFFGIGIIVIAWYTSDSLVSQIIDFIPFVIQEVDIVSAIIKILVWVLIAAISYMAYKYVILIIAAPFMSPLSEKVERKLRSDTRKVQFSLGRALSDIWRGVRVSLRNLSRELLYTFIAFLFGFVPVIGLLSGPAILAIQAYFVGFGNMDYTLERHMNVKASASFVKDYKGLAVANGGIFLLILMIPVIGLFLAPSLATVAGTIETVDRLDHEGSLT